MTAGPINPTGDCAGLIIFERLLIYCLLDPLGNDEKFRGNYDDWLNWGAVDTSYCFEAINPPVDNGVFDPRCCGSSRRLKLF